MGFWGFGAELFDESPGDAVGHFGELGCVTAEGVTEEDVLFQRDVGELDDFV